MDKSYLTSWWAPSEKKSVHIAMRIGASALWVLAAAELIQRLQTGQIAPSATTAGMLLWLSALLVSPQCWGIVAAADGSASRKVVTSIVLFGVLIQLSGLVARFTVPG